MAVDALATKDHRDRNKRDDAAKDCGYAECEHGDSSHRDAHRSHDKSEQPPKAAMICDTHRAVVSGFAEDMSTAIAGLEEAETHAFVSGSDHPSRSQGHASATPAIAFRVSLPAFAAWRGWA